mmetsp:Transcript_34458/g.85843  ORF Transcript_34458/g.85843 Transcript_34458/m.85843 type:complete len:212 (+) Transcript_34458:297-932(+)
MATTARCASTCTRKSRSWRRGRASRSAASRRGRSLRMRSCGRSATPRRAAAASPSFTTRRPAAGSAAPPPPRTSRLGRRARRARPSSRPPPNLSLRREPRHRASSATCESAAGRRWRRSGSWRRKCAQWRRWMGRDGARPRRLAELSRATASALRASSEVRGPGILLGCDGSCARLLRSAGALAAALPAPGRTRGRNAASEVFLSAKSSIN